MTSQKYDGEQKIHIYHFSEMTWQTEAFCLVSNLVISCGHHFVTKKRYICTKHNIQKID